MTRLDFLYHEIAQNYEGFVFILVADRSDYKIEKYFAFSTESVYWVSNGRYKNENKMSEGKKNEVLKEVKKDVESKDDGKALTKKIDEFKDWLNDQQIGRRQNS